MAIRRSMSELSNRQNADDPEQGSFFIWRNCHKLAFWKTVNR